MGVCPIPTSESDKKTKMQTIVQRYDPISRRIIDIRLTCIISKLIWLLNAKVIDGGFATNEYMYSIDGGNDSILYENILDGNST